MYFLNEEFQDGNPGSRPVEFQIQLFPKSPGSDLASQTEIEQRLLLASTGTYLANR
jgi:hypothetical protein